MTAISDLLQSYRSSILNLNPNQYLCFSRFATISSGSLRHDRPQELLTNPTVLTQFPEEEHEDPVPPFSNSQKERQRRAISLIKFCSHKTHLLQIHAYLVRTSLIQDSTASSAFLSRSAFPPLRDMTYSRQIFSQISDPSVSQYNAMIRGYSMSDSPEEGVHVYQLMRRRGVRPNPLSSTFVIKSCIRLLSLRGGTQIHARILRDGHMSDSILLTSLMDLYSSCKKGYEACNMFEEMPRRDAVAWNVLISCYMNNGRIRDALDLFDIMQSPSYRTKPDDVSCLLLLQASAHLVALEFGEKVHNYVEEQGYGDALNICNSLILMYSRCGCLRKAYEVFREMPERNVVSWSTMISGLAMNGHGREAIEAFREMLGMGVPPDEQTFTGVLSACSHSGLVDEGMMFFDCMSKEFGIVPNIHHYGCMVDLLGRAGLLDHAYQLVISMGFKPDPTIWRTLLGACRIHGHVALGERVIEHLIELKAQEAGDYVLLLNMYSSDRNWEKVMEVRSLMKEKGIQTTPGCSTIEMKGKLHEFAVDDISHPRMGEIYEMLDEINKQLKIAGYVAEISSELHNLDAEEKANRLSYHSEKLAIAFGVLATPPGTIIKVAKNLRTCVDCHNFAKFLSGVYNRKVIIRDRIRFHHFHEGCCSCNDYW
ncbi:pentatricopeptide repeat-containing protein At3g47530 [Malania oleifera]|uniref:pentatricopeptide repeat-containing protein At3g47530 n=1 Tax=Malania oleifera TaxID=397392 RepID=UPI0025AE674F|nr:pentatricopeptide repeat-containing protein At3g47530 [Malania oleifera]